MHTKNDRGATALPDLDAVLESVREAVRSTHEMLERSRKLLDPSGSGVKEAETSAYTTNHGRTRGDVGQ